MPSTSVRVLMDAGLAVPPWDELAHPQGARRSQNQAKEVGGEVHPRFSVASSPRQVVGAIGEKGQPVGGCCGERQPPRTWMDGVWRLSQTVSLCGMVCNLLETRPWSLSVVTGLPGPGRLTMVGQHLSRIVWRRGWSWLLRLVAGGASKLPTSWFVWRRRSHRIHPFVMHGVQQAFIRRWSAFLACSAVRAFSASFLDHPFSA